MADPKIKFDIEAAVSGAADIQALAQRLEDMGKVMGGDLGPAAKAAAAEMRALGQQQEAIAAFGKLSAQVRQSEQDLALAQKSAKSFATEIGTAGPPTAAQAAALARLNTEVQNNQAKLGGQKEALHAANQELLSYGLTGDRLIEAQRKTSAAVDALKTSVQTSIPAFKAVGAEGQQSARQIQDAWSTLGTRSFAQTQVEIAKVKAALEAIKASSKSPIEIKIATEAAQAKIKQLEGGVTAVGTAGSSVAGILRQLGPLMAGAFSAQAFLSTITSAESLSRSYEQVFGSTAKARTEMKFIKTTANQLGLETLQLAASYQSLAASTKGTVLEGKATRDVFEAVSRAMSTLGKSSQETDRALTAISQIASKGTASMEELRGQLGEALPGAMKAAADGAGITTEQLVEMVSSGSVLAKDILPALTKGLNDLYGKAAPPDTVISEWARFKNVLTDTAIAIGEGGASQGIAKGLSGLATAAKYASLGVDILGTSIGEGAAALVSWNGSLTTSQELGKKYGIQTVEQAAAAEKAAAAQKALTAAQNGTGQSAQEASSKQELYDKSLVSTGETILSVKQKYGELAKGSADYILQIEKEVAARNAETSVLTQLVGIYGTETEKRQVAVSVSQAQAAMAEKLAAARNTESLIAASYVLKLKEEAQATGDVTEATKKQIDEAQKSAAAKQTEFERTDALAKSKRIEAEATIAQTQALKDNSARVYEYRGAVAAASVEVARISQLHKEGKATDTQLSEARAKLSASTLLYRDALADATAKAERNIAVTQQKAELEQASISVDMERVKAAQEVATALGNSAEATKLSSEATELQIKSARASAEAARAEAAGIRDAADKKEQEAKATGQLTDAVKEDIAARRRSADLKDIEGQKSDILASKIRALAEANNSETASLEAKNAALERTIAAQEKANDLAERAIALENKRLNRDKEGFSLNTAGNRVVMNQESERSVYDAAKKNGLTDAQALQIASQFIQNGQQAGWNGSGAQDGENWNTALNKAIDAQVLANARDAAASRSQPTQTLAQTLAQTPSSAAAAATPGTYRGPAQTSS